MSPEEKRWTRIENALQSVAENQAEHAVEVAELRRIQKSLMVAMGKLAEAQLKTEHKLDQLTTNIDRFLKGRGPNGQRQ